MSLGIVKKYLKSCIFCLHYILYLPVWIRIRIRNTDPDPGSSWKRIQYGSGSTTLVKIYHNYSTVFDTWISWQQKTSSLYCTLVCCLILLFFTYRQKIMIIFAFFKQILSKWYRYSINLTRSRVFKIFLLELKFINTDPQHCHWL